MEGVPQADGPNNTRTSETQDSGLDVDNRETVPGNESDLTAEGQSLLDSFRKDSTDDRWDYDEPDTEEEPSEHDLYIRERVGESNEELAKEPAPDEVRRTSIKFKENIVDLVVPPPDYDDDDQSDRNLSTPSQLEQNRATTDREEYISTAVEVRDSWQKWLAWGPIWQRIYEAYNPDLGQTHDTLLCLEK